MRGRMRIPRELAPAILRLYGALAVLPALALGTLLVFYAAAFEGRIYPHVVVGGVDVGGLSLTEARAALRASAGELLAQPLTLRAGPRLTLSSLGVVLPPSAIDGATSAAHAVGRGAPHDPAALVRHQLLLWQHGEQLPLVLELDNARARAALDQLATYFERPAANAHLELVPTEQGYELHTLPAVVGERIDREATLDRLRAFLGSGVALGPHPAALTLDVVIVSIAPAISDGDVEALRAQIEATVGAPLVFRRGDGESWSLEPAALAGAVRLEGLDPVAYYARSAVAPRPALVLDDERLSALVNAVADLADRPAEEPALESRGERVAVRPGRPGQLIDRAAALTAARETLAAAGAGGMNRVVQLTTTDAQPVGDPAALEPVAQWLTERLALPLLLEHQGSRRFILQTDLIRLLALKSGTPGLDRAAVRTFLAASLPAWVRLESTSGVVEPSLALRGGSVEIVSGRAGQ
ncbi:MAG TPA: peptidoglycan binding domain-containing protein, partial [Chloroflexota bacterium]|nr:peptidoglycan binding domain-containing protein [Chloroflexota bacterium]